MKIWVLDPDVSFAVSFKEKLKALNHKPTLYFEEALFLEDVEKGKRDKTKIPDVLVIEADLPTKPGLKLLHEIQATHPHFTPEVQFLSHVSFGGFEAMAQELGRAVPSFFQKSQWERHLEKMISGWIESKAQKENKKNEPVLSPSQKRAFKEAEKQYKELSDLYYANVLGPEADAKIADAAKRILNHLQILGWKKAATQAANFLRLKELTSSVPKLKKELKDLISLCDVEIKKVKPD